MSNETNACQCCDPVVDPTAIYNQPGLTAIAFRIGTHARFKAAMIEALKDHEELDDLTTRSDDDPSIALIDGWATVLDVLTFYQERIANEGYLNTATERRSILELARSIGYELNPGVAASTMLAFSLDTNAKAPGEASIDKGTKVQNVPKQDKSPQTFETIEKLEARAEWNAMLPKLRETIVPKWGHDTVYLKGTSANLQPGDAILLVGSQREKNETSDVWDCRRVKSATPVYTDNTEDDYTIVGLDRPLGKETPYGAVPADPKVYVFRRRASLFGSNAPDWNVMPEEIRAAYSSTFAEKSKIFQDWKDSGNWVYVAIAILYLYDGDDWPGLTLEDINDGSETTIILDAVYPKIVPGSWIVLSCGDNQELYDVEATTEDSPVRFTLTAKVSSLAVKGENLFAYFGDAVRQTVVFAESEELELSSSLRTDTVSGQEVLLNNAITHLEKGRTLMFRGADAGGKEIVEIASVDSCFDTEDGSTTIVLNTPLELSFERATLKILGNVAQATHGESKTESLGGGNAGATFQNFQLKQTPLTFTPSTDINGSASTLEVRVNDVLWKEASSLYALGPKDRRYITRRSDDGTVTVQFGDGETGARLPTGSENIRAGYRVGIGLEGNLDKDTVTTLLTRPLGVNEVTNPEASSGGDDPEERDEARGKAPFTVRTLDRIVSLLDFEDYARTFAGIGKARADWVWQGKQRIVFVTVAGVDGNELDENLPPFSNLVPAIDAIREPFQPMRIGMGTALAFGLEAKILVLPDYESEIVFDAIYAALIDAFSFDKRSFAQPVFTSEVIGVIQSVEGVLAVDLDNLYLTNGRTDVVVHPARWCREVQELLPAELLTIDSTAVTLKEMVQ